MGFMNHLSKIARNALPSTGVQFRKSHYGSKEIRDFLRDVMALANANVDGPRYLFTGIDCDASGKKRLHSVPAEDFTGKPSYQSLVADFVEPPIRVRYKPMSIEGKRIKKYCGVIAGEAILGANLFKDLFAGIRDLVGGRSATYERELQRAREIALQELEDRAADLGANAVVGIDLDYEVLGQTNGMLMVSASGTAVVVE